MDGWMDGGRNFSPRVYFCDHGSWFFFPSTIVVKGKGNECWERWDDVYPFFSPASAIPTKLVDLCSSFFFLPRKSREKSLSLFLE